MFSQTRFELKVESETKDYHNMKGYIIKAQKSSQFEILQVIIFKNFVHAVEYGNTGCGVFKRRVQN